jgi:hypothetical protein
MSRKTRSIRGLPLEISACLAFSALPGPADYAPPVVYGPVHGSGFGLSINLR